MKMGGEIMKFLLLTRQKDAMLMLPPEKRMEIFRGMSAFMEKYINSGKCEHAYFDGDMKGASMVWEVASSEEGARLTTENPMSPFIDIEFRPIVDWKTGLKVQMEFMQKMAQK
jgi:hypothetical protein